MSTENTCLNCGIPSEESYCPLCHPLRDIPTKDLREMLLAARAEAKTHKQTIDAVIVASKWDGCDGLAKFIKQIRIEKDEAQQWIDSEPDWKDKYNAQMVAVIAERGAERLARQAAEKECKAKLELRTRRMLATINDLGAQLSEKGATLRATRDADHGAAVEAAARDAESVLKWVMNYESRLPESADGTPAWRILDSCLSQLHIALVATVTNSQQKGGEEPCAAPACLTTTTKIEIAHLTEATSNAAPTSNPEGAATSYDECLICGKPVFGYVPQICCSGFECGCMGQPINPCVCSERCDKALYENIGMGFEERRIKCGIGKWVDTATPLPGVTETAKACYNAAQYRQGISPLHEIESILSRLLGAREHELRELRAECERQKPSSRRPSASG